MSDTAEDLRALTDHRRALRAKYAIECPRCKAQRPRANATKLLPQQRCRVDGYIDPRPDLTVAQLEDV